MCVDNGRVVSHVGMVQRTASLCGCTVHVACIGAVSTYPEYRGQGLASRVFQAACDKARADGVDFMMISGGRTLYSRAGATGVGCDDVALIAPAMAEQAASRDVDVAVFIEPDLSGCADWYQRRRDRFLRPLDDWRAFFACETAMCQEAGVLVIRRKGLLCGYLVVARTDKEGVAQIIEFAGDDLAIAAALKPVLDRRGSKAIRIRLQTGDYLLKKLLERTGASFQPDTTSGTFLLINFPQFMERMRPLFEIRVGLEPAASLIFEENGGRCVFKAEGEMHSFDKIEAAHAIFGKPGQPPLPGLLGNVFPIPSLWYGLNYV